MLSSQELLKRLQPSRILRVNEEISSEKAHNGEMYLWKDNDGDWNFHITLQNHHEKGLLDEQQDKKIIHALDKFNDQSREDLTTAFNSFLLIDLSRCYLNLSGATQLFIANAMQTHIPVFSAEHEPPTKLAFCDGFLNPSCTQHANFDGRARTLLENYHGEKHGLLVKNTLSKDNSLWLTAKDKELFIEKLVCRLVSVLQADLQAELGQHAIVHYETPVTPFCEKNLDTILTQVKAKYCHLVNDERSLPAQLAPSTIYIWKSNDSGIWNFGLEYMGQRQSNSFDKHYDAVIYGALNRIKDLDKPRNLTAVLGSAIIDRMSEAYLGLTVDVQSKFFGHLKSIWPFHGNTWDAQQIVDVCLGMLNGQPINTTLVPQQVVDQFRYNTFPAIFSPEIIAGELFSSNDPFKVNHLLNHILQITARVNGYDGDIVIDQHAMYCKVGRIYPCIHAYLLGNNTPYLASLFLQYYMKGMDRLTVPELMALIGAFDHHALNHFGVIDTHYNDKENASFLCSVALEPSSGNMQRAFTIFIQRMLQHLSKRLDEMSMPEQDAFIDYFFKHGMDLLEMLAPLHPHQQSLLIHAFGGYMIECMDSSAYFTSVLKILAPEAVITLFDILGKNLFSSQTIEETYQLKPLLMNSPFDVFAKLSTLLLSIDSSVLKTVVDLIDILRYLDTERRSIFLKKCSPHFHKFLHHYTDINDLINALTDAERDIYLFRLALCFKGIYKNHIELQYVLCDLTEQQALFFLGFLGDELSKIKPELLGSNKIITHANVLLLMDVLNRFEEEPHCFIPLREQENKLDAIQRAAESYVTSVKNPVSTQQEMNSTLEHLNLFHKTPYMRLVRRLQQPHLSYEELLNVVKELLSRTNDDKAEVPFSFCLQWACQEVVSERLKPQNDQIYLDLSRA